MSNQKIYDYLIVGSGFFGAICAYELGKHGKKCLVLDRRNHIGGNCYSQNMDGINIHKYGPHIFHTSNAKVWKWINQFVEFNNFRLTPLANYKGEIYSLPFNMWTFNKLWGVRSPAEAEEIIRKQSIHIDEPSNLEEQAIKLVGIEVYNKLIKGYTTKQWMREPSSLPKEIIKRLPVRLTYDNNYFNDLYQGIPIGGYTQIFKKLLCDTDIKLGVNYLLDRGHWNSLASKIIYTGPIDEFFDYEDGELEYKSTDFDHKQFDLENYQGSAIVYYTDLETPFTRVIEHKHFEFNKTPNTHVTWEYPKKYKAGITEAYYPVNDSINNQLYLKYKNRSLGLKNTYFGGRLAEYKYYDMHDVIDRALNFADSLAIE